MKRWLPSLWQRMHVLALSLAFLPASLAVQKNMGEARSSCWPPRVRLQKASGCDRHLSYALKL